MFLRYNTQGKFVREVKINLTKIQVVSWRYSYTSKQEKTNLYFVYYDSYNQKNSLYVPMERLLDKPALFEYLETNFKDKCLEK